MAELLKNVYSEKFLHEFEGYLSYNNLINNTIEISYPQFHSQWKILGVRQRQQAIARWLSNILPDDFQKTIQILEKMLLYFQQKEYNNLGFTFLFIPEVILERGENRLEESFSAMEKITQFVSCEFVVRYFLKANFQKSMKLLEEFSTHSHPAVRRFASEACRPYLPWGGNLPEVIQNSTPIFLILKNLMHDDFKFVQISVANNLNDISKFQSETVLEWCKKYKNTSKSANWIIQKALRTLLKNGNSQALGLLGWEQNTSQILHSFSICSDLILKNQQQTVRISLENHSTIAQKIRVEYVLYYPLSNQKKGKKVFWVGNVELLPSIEKKWIKNLNFDDLTTRKYLSGEYFIELKINGKGVEKKTFVYQK